PAYFDLSLKDALLATVVGGLIGNSMLAAAALVGADGRVPTMVLQRAPLGQRGSYIATVLNVLQCLGWAIFELIVIATAAGLLSDKLFGFKAVWLWKLLFGGLATLLASGHPPRLVLARGRHRRRRDGLVGAARRRLHALLPRPAARLLRRRNRIPAADAVPVRVRLDPRALARSRPEPPRADPDRDRRGRRGRGAG